MFLERNSLTLKSSDNTNKGNTLRQFTHVGNDIIKSPVSNFKRPFDSQYDKTPNSRNQAKAFSQISTRYNGTPVPNDISHHMYQSPKNAESRNKLISLSTRKYEVLGPLSRSPSYATTSPMTQEDLLDYYSTIPTKNGQKFQLNLGQNSGPYRIRDKHNHIGVDKFASMAKSPVR